MQNLHGNQAAMSAHRKVKASTTLNRKYVRVPVRNNTDITVSVKKSPRVKHFDIQQVDTAAQADEPIQPAAVHPLQKIASQKMQERQSQMNAQPVKKMTAQELKEQAIKKALSEAKTTEVAEQKPKKAKLHFGFPRIALALSCAAAAVFVIVYFANLNMPDISLKVAAMQTGFDATYPSYVPRDYSLTGITSEEGKVILNFVNHGTSDAFSIKEEKSAWDSSALLNNYVKENFDDNYLVIKEQGLTLYVSNNTTVWVNGGVFYELKVESGTLTKKQIKSIAASL